MQFDYRQVPLTYLGPDSKSLLGLFVTMLYPQ